MTGIEELERCFLPLDGREPPEPCFFRIIGRDGAGRIPALLERCRSQARLDGAWIRDGIPNPGEPEIARFLDAVGPRFAPNRALIERHMTVWLGQLRPEPRRSLSAALLDALALLRAQGANDSVLRNTYIKFMCWFRGPLGRVMTGLGRPAPPKLLFEGNISRHEVLLLRLLHRAGCDVWYVHPGSEGPYQKADPGGRFSRLIQGEVLEPLPDSGQGAPPPARPAAMPEASVHRYVHPIRTARPPARSPVEETLSYVLEALERQSERLEEVLRRLDGDKPDTM